MLGNKLQRGARRLIWRKHGSQIQEIRRARIKEKPRMEHRTLCAQVNKTIGRDIHETGTGNSQN